MAFSTHITEDDTITIIRTGGKFDYNSHTEFRDAYKDNDSAMKYVIDMRETDYMDSSALGMMLLLREHAGCGSADIKIMNCNNEIHKILEISNFHKLFQIQ